MGKQRRNRKAGASEGGVATPARDGLEALELERDVQETVRVLHTVDAAKDEFQHLADEVKEVRAKFTQAIIHYKKRYDQLLGTVGVLQEATTAQKMVGMAAAIFRSMISFAQLFTTDMAELFQTTVDILMHGLQRRVAHFQQLFKTTVAVVEEELAECRSLLDEHGYLLQGLQDELRLVRQQRMSMEAQTARLGSELEQLRKEVSDMRMKRTASMLLDPPRGRELGTTTRLGRVRSESLRCLREARRREDTPEMIRQAQFLATVDVETDVTHPLRTQARSIWQQEHGQWPCLEH
jgi:chromosome segregation ATPase